jgi:hypothetical protein
MRRQIGVIAVGAVLIDETLLLLEQANIVREILPNWMANQKTAIAVGAVGLIAILVPEKWISKSDSSPTPASPPHELSTAMNVGQIAKTTTREIIRFDYLPVSPIERGWTKAYKPDGTATFSSDPDIEDSLRMRVTQSEFAMDYIVPVHATLANRLIFTAKYDNGATTGAATMIFAFVEVSTKNGELRKRVWIKFYFGDKHAFQTPGLWHDPAKQLPEQTMYWPAEPFERGQLKFDIDLIETVRVVLGAHGWIYKGIYKIRLRGDLSISPIEFAS